MSADRPIEETPDLRERLDGCGSLLKGPFVKVVRRQGRKFSSAFEWCAGMGEIGFAILKAGLCDRLCLADINPEAIDVARQIAAREGLADKVDFFVGDGLSALPEGMKFDLVVANPPNFFNVQKDHPYGAVFFDDLRPNDRGWRIHESFYAGIRRFLLPDAVLLIEEVEPFKTKVFLGHPSGYKGPYDIRDEAPMKTFERMTRANGLKIDSADFLAVIDDIRTYVLKITQA